MGSSAPALIYDAECPFCRGAIDWVRRNAPSPGAFEFLPCRSEETRRRFPDIGEAACLRAVHLVLPDGKVLIGERALPEIVRRLPRWRRAAALFALPGAGFLSRLLYRWVAARRQLRTPAAGSCRGRMDRTPSRGLPGGSRGSSPDRGSGDTA